MILKVKKLDPTLELEYMSAGAAGLDLPVAEDTYILPYNTKLVKTGIAVEIPEGYEGQIRPRSSISKSPLIVQNSPGTIDSDYRGEILVAVRNMSGELFELYKYNSVAQLVICPTVQVAVEYVDELSETDRGAGGFGSTNK